MQEIIFLRGLPASGKTTWALDYCKDNPNFRRINKDEIRDILGNHGWSKEFEKEVLELQRKIGLEYLEEGFSLIIDDTNFAEKHHTFWMQMATEGGLDFTEKEFIVPVEECIRRDKEREKSVDEKVIRGMHKRYVKPSYIKTDERVIAKQNSNLPKCIIVDIDGTLALINGRSPFDDTKIHTDKPNQSVIDLVTSKYYQYEYIKDYAMDDNFLGASVILLSGRQDKCMSETLEWLKKYDIPFDSIYMRKTGDFRKDSVIKKELYEKYIKDNYYVEYVLDDRDQVVKQWRELGLLCLQVYYGDF